MSESVGMPWTVAHQGPTLPFPSPGDPPNPGLKPPSPTLAGRFVVTESPGKLKPEIYLKIIQEAQTSVTT